MADAKFSIAQINITNNLRVVAREVSNPLAEVANVIYLAPHSGIRNIVITGLAAKTHYFDFYETTATSGSSPIGTFLTTFTIDLGLVNQSLVEFIEFVVGDVDAPANGDTDYVNTSLDGIDEANLQISQRSVGIRSWNDEIELLSGGGFSLLNGELFNELDRWFIMVTKEATSVAPPASGNVFDDVKFINGNITIDNTHYNNLLVMAGSSGWQEIEFEDLSTIPNKTRFSFNTLDGTATGVIIKIKAGASGTIQTGFIGGDTIFYLRKYETVSFIVYDEVLWLYDGKGNWDNVGDIKYGENINGTCIKEEGQWVDIDDEPRFFYWFVNKLPLGYLAASSTTETGKFFIDLPNNRFRMPNADNRLLLSANTSNPGNENNITANTSNPTNTIARVKYQFLNRVL